MDFLDPAKRQAHIRRLFLGYFLVGIAIALASTIMVILSNGYDVDRKTGKVIQNGLIFTDAAPEAATIYLNGKETGQTDKRLTVPSGTYDLQLKRTGYDSWKKTFQLEGGSIERFIYPRLFPTKLVTAEAKEYDSKPNFYTQSPDRRWIIVGTPGKLTSFDIYDTDNPQTDPKTITINPDLLSAPKAKSKESLVLVEWSTDNRHILVEHTYGKKTEFLVLDRDKPNESVNINNLLKVQPTKVTLRDKKFDKLHIYSAKTKLLQFADTKSKKVTDLISEVTDYKSYQDDIIVYTIDDPATPKLTNVRIWQDNKSYPLRTVKAGPVLMEMASFDRATFIGIAPISEGRMLIYKDPMDKLEKLPKEELAPFTLMKIAAPAKLSFSNNTRFLAAQGGAAFAVYDFEDNRRFNFVMPGKVEPEQHATWMDGHRLLLNQDSRTLVVEFDGNNQRDLGAIIPDTIPAFDRNYQRMYTLSSVKDAKKKASLTRTSLRVNLTP